VEKVATDITKILKEYKSLLHLAERCKQLGDIAGYLECIGTDETVCYPSYWEMESKKTSEADSKASLLDLPADHPLYEEVSTLLLKTFDSSMVGKGFDAARLKHSKLVVKKISYVQNKFLFQQYVSKKKQLCLKYAVNRPPAIVSYAGGNEILTRQICLNEGEFRSFVSLYI
jgi:hypothetical protein